MGSHTGETVSLRLREHTSNIRAIRFYIGYKIKNCEFIIFPCVTKCSMRAFLQNFGESADFLMELHIDEFFFSINKMNFVK